MADSKTTFLQNSHMLSVFKRNVSFLFNHSKIQKKKYNLSMGNLGNQHMNQVKSVMILRNGKAIEKHILKPSEKKYDKSIFEDKKRVEPEHCKEKTDSSPVLSFSHVMTNQWKVNHNS